MKGGNSRVDYQMNAKSITRRFFQRLQLEVARQLRGQRGWNTKLEISWLVNIWLIIFESSSPEKYQE